MNREDITKLIEDLELNHEYCPKEVILQAAAELRGMQERIQLLYEQLNEAEKQLDAQYQMGVEAEREACAKVCDDVDKESLSQWPQRLATMIRARGNHA
jgi:hypothetical protein